ncbi:MAG: 3-oxoacyl-[acyl-carrier protein] reductase [Alphaproteobacteria bacterium]|nr:3-oxoacyl-[acyl-carrier protein] reductase [Alphaproteobacteria bacterium]
MAHRGKLDGVQVNCIHPSFVETGRQWRRIKAEMERSGEPEDAVRNKITGDAGIIRFGKVEDVADLVTFLVSARATWMHGATIDLDGGEIAVL